MFKLFARAVKLGILMALTATVSITLIVSSASARGMVDRVASLWRSDEPSFDPAVTSDRTKELDALRKFEGDWKPKLMQAQSLIRKQAAEIQYLKEISSFVESRIPADEMERLRTELSKIADGKRSLDASYSVPARTWLANRIRINALETSLERLLFLEQRITQLYGTLEHRREETLALVPQQGQSVVSKTPSETDATEDLLIQVHERLFKVLYSLDPKLVSDSPSGGVKISAAVP